MIEPRRNPIDHRAVADAVRRIALEAATGGQDRPASTKADVAIVVAVAATASDAAHHAVHEAVGRARSAGLSWSEIGQILGISRQAAYQRFGKRSGGRLS